MMMNNEYNNTPSQSEPRSLPNSTLVLVLGILAILGCGCYGILGIVLSIIALVLAARDTRMYRQNPYLFSRSSFNNLTAGKVCAIISLVLSILFILVMFWLISTVGVENLSDPERMREILEANQ